MLIRVLSWSAKNKGKEQEHKEIGPWKDPEGIST